MPDARVKIGATYKHFKGGLYKVLNLARGSDSHGFIDQSIFVVYEPLEKTGESPSMFVRTIIDFCGFVLAGKDYVKRFKLLEKTDGI
jgi:hypothetical protein